MLRTINNINQHHPSDRGGTSDNWNSSGYQYDGSNYNPDKLDLNTNILERVSNAYIAVKAYQSSTESLLSGMGSLSNDGANAVDNVNLGDVDTAKTCLSSTSDRIKHIVGRISDAVVATVNMMNENPTLYGGMPLGKISPEEYLQFLNKYATSNTSEIMDFVSQRADGVGINIDENFARDLGLDSISDRLTKSLFEGLLFSSADSTNTLALKILLSVFAGGTSSLAKNDGVLSGIMSSMGPNLTKLIQRITNFLPQETSVDMLSDIFFGSIIAAMDKEGLTGEEFLRIVTYSAVSNTNIPFLSSIAASVASEFACDPFTSDGVVDQDACIEAALEIIMLTVGGEVATGWGTPVGKAGAIAGMVLGYLYGVFSHKNPQYNDISYMDDPEFWATIGI